MRGALKALQGGTPILLYDADGREEETDLVFPSQSVTPESIRLMRQQAGGLVCTTFPTPVAKRLGLPLMEDALTSLKEDFPVIEGLLRHRPAYDARSAFSLTVNHQATRTGITDRDRARTVGALAEACRYALASDDGLAREAFMREFRTPGHVHLLIAAEPLLRERCGHTELSTALLIMAELLPSATLCEMLADGGGALTKGEATNMRQPGIFPSSRGATSSRLGEHGPGHGDGSLRHPPHRPSGLPEASKGSGGRVGGGHRPRLARASDET